MSDQPYAGLLYVPDGGVIDDEANAGRRHGQVAKTAPHLLVSGRTGLGKSRSVLAPNILRWGARPVVAMSSKGDLAELTIRKRAERGPVFLVDLSGEVRESELRGVNVTRVMADPCALIDNDDDALSIASLLIETSSDEGEGGFWAKLALRPLAAILRAGGWFSHPLTGERTWGGGIAWAMRAADDPGPDQGSEEQAKKEVDDVYDYESPNWNVAFARCDAAGSGLARAILSAKAKDPRQRDSVAINMQVALTPWSMSGVSSGHTPFRPAMLAARGATLFIVSPMTGAAGPVAAMTLVQIVDFWRKRVGQLDEIMFVLDELPNGAPIPAKRFRGWIGEGRGLGIRVVAAVQATSQFTGIWKDADVNILRDIFPAVLILPGAPEKELLESAAEMGGMEERTTGSTGADGGTSQSRDRFDALTASDLRPRRKGEGRLLLSGMPGVRVKLPDIAETTLLD